jgi:hypothetical protein
MLMNFFSRDRPLCLGDVQLKKVTEAEQTFHYLKSLRRDDDCIF